MDHIDPKSVIVFAAGSVVIALVICLALRRHKSDDQAMKWIVGCNISLFAAAMGVLGRPLLGFEVGSFLVIAGAYTGICCGYLAVLAAEGQRLPIRPLALTGLVGLAIQQITLPGIDPIVMMMLTSSLINSALTACIIWRIWHLTIEYGSRIATLVCLPFAAFFLGYFLRLCALAIWPDFDTGVATTLVIIIVMAWAAVILELAMIALRETQARKALNAALKRADAANAARSRFLLSISHELRTPLNGILGLSELMRAGALGPMPDAYSRYPEEIHRNGQDLLSLITDLLDLSSIETGSVDLDREDIPSETCLGDIRVLFGARAQEAGLTLRTSTDTHVPATLYADRERLDQILHRLLDNAIRFTGAGGEVSVHIGWQAGAAVIRISDTGRGMTDEQITRAQDLFGRSNGVGDANEGIGVGLPIAREIALAHEGTFSIESAVDIGTTVTITLPPRPREDEGTQEEEVAPPFPLSAKRAAS